MCAVCNQTEKTKHKLKSHIFYKHWEDQVQNVFQKSFEDCIGSYMLQRLRKVAFNAVVYDSFDTFIFGMIGFSKEETMLRYSEFRMPGYLFKSEMGELQDDHLLKRREMLLKAARSIPGASELQYL